MNNDSNFDSGHLQIRNGILDHLASGQMTPDMFTAYYLMLARCNFATGVWHGSAERLVAETGGVWSLRTAQRVLERLIDGGYISSTYKRGKRGNYDILISNYVPTIGDKKGKKLRPRTVNPLENPSDSTVTSKSDDTTDATSESSDKSDDTGDAILAKVTTKVTTPVASVQEGVQEIEKRIEQQVSKERKKALASLATLATPTVVPVPTEASAEVLTLASVWLTHTGCEFVPDDYSLAQALVDNEDQGYGRVEQVLFNTLVERPKSSGMDWTDFHVFADNYSLNRRKAIAWDRKMKTNGKSHAVDRPPAPAPPISAKAAFEVEEDLD